jgi:hypothetical protein
MLAALGLTLLSSAGLFFNLLTNAATRHSLLQGRPFLQVSYELFIPALSGFPLRTYQLCVMEFNKCVWSGPGKLNLLADFFFWLALVGLAVWIDQRVSGQKATTLSRHAGLILLASALLLPIATAVPALSIFLLNTSSRQDANRLDDAIDAYMQAQSGMYCSHLPAGRDAEHAYTWMLCESCQYNRHGAVETLSGFSIPTRLDVGPDGLTILAYRQPQDGTLYQSSWQALFPPAFRRPQPDSAQMAALEFETRWKFLAELDPSLRARLQVFTQLYPQYNDWGLDPGFAGKSLAFKTQADSYYFAFITHGSGVGVVQADCFELRADGSSRAMPVKNLTFNTRGIDPLTCQGY